MLNPEETHQLRIAGLVIRTARTLDDLALATTALANVVKSAGLSFTEKALDFLMPGGQSIGRQGYGRNIRVVPGGLPAARQAFDYLSFGSTPFSSSYKGTMVTLPGGIGRIGLRPVTSSPGSPAIDVFVPGIRFGWIHY